MKTEEQLLQQLASLCATKECCLQDLRKRLEKSELPEEAQVRILQRLQAERFVDEARFARSFASDKFRFNHWGRIKINYELSQRGIPTALREAALEAIEEEPYRETLTDHHGPHHWIGAGMSYSSSRQLDATRHVFLFDLCLLHCQYLLFHYFRAQRGTA